ncbi:MAG TPA: hypothetical protein VMQ44_03895 [Candidatus Saccharimonadales bacterium]|nr:hypothetical protein [Candidatus Saccharimonadales bacterium]
MSKMGCLSRARDARFSSRLIELWNNDGLRRLEEIRAALERDGWPTPPPSIDQLEARLVHLQLAGHLH